MLGCVLSCFRILSLVRVSISANVFWAFADSNWTRGPTTCGDKDQSSYHTCQPTCCLALSENFWLYSIVARLSVSGSSDFMIILPVLYIFSFPVMTMGLEEEEIPDFYVASNDETDDREMLVI